MQRSAEPAARRGKRWMGQRMGRKQAQIQANTAQIQGEEAQPSTRTAILRACAPPAEPAARRCFFCAGVLLEVYFFFFFCGA